MAISRPLETFLPLDRQSYFRIDTLQHSDGVIYEVIPEDLAASRKVTYRHHFPDSVPTGAGLYQIFGEDNPSFLGKEIDNGGQTLETSSYRLGKFCVLIDTIAPSIRQIRPRNASQTTAPRPTVTAILDDGLSGVDEISVRIDGRWLVTEYDPESGAIRARPHFNLTLGKHRLDIIVTDKQGNVRHHKGEFSFVD
jgi:hypothetical protein